MTARYTGLMGIREQPREIANCANLRAAARGQGDLLRLDRNVTMAQQPQPSDNIIRVRDITVQFGKNRILDEWCAKVGRDPREIERSAQIFGSQLDQLDDPAEYVDECPPVFNGRPLAFRCYDAEGTLRTAAPNPPSRSGTWYVLLNRSTTMVSWDMQIAPLRRNDSIISRTKVLD